MNHWACAGMALCGLVLATVPQVAVATATSNAAITGFRYTLLDMTPADAFAPGLAIDYSRSNGSSVARSSMPDHVENVSAPGWLPTTSAVVSAPFGIASASTGPAGGMASQWVVGAAGQNGTDAYATPYHMEFTLAPWTSVTFTVDFAGTATTTVGWAEGNSEIASASASLALIILAEGGGIEDRADSSQRVRAYVVWDGTKLIGETNAFFGEVSLTFSNASASSRSGALFGTVFAAGLSAIPVPEPAPMALMLSGMVGLAVALRVPRRQGRTTGSA